jgi:hypothetical protein
MEDRRDHPLRRGVANVFLVLLSTLLTYFLIQSTFYSFLLPSLSLNLLTFMPETTGVLMQNSKAHYLPQDYVALLGDSYAEGVGDWLLQANGNRAKPFHSANVIHDATGRDVVSFGKEAYGSAQELVLAPARLFPAKHCWIFPAIEPPREMFLYFYEGNDVFDNDMVLSDARQIFNSGSAETVERYLKEKMAAPPGWWACQLHLADTAVRMATFAYRYYVEGVELPAARPNENTLLVAGQTIAAPTLQGPPVRLSEAEIQRTMPVLALGLAWIENRFPDIPLTIVYLPGPLPVYRHAGETVSYHRSIEPSTVVPLAKVLRTSDLVCNMVRTIALEHHAKFLDARPALRAAATTQVVHGPRDWFHFNEAGYRTLGNLVVERMRGGAESDACGPLADK